MVIKKCEMTTYSAFQPKATRNTCEVKQVGLLLIEVRCLSKRMLKPIGIRLWLDLGEGLRKCGFALSWRLSKWGQFYFVVAQ